MMATAFADLSFDDAVEHVLALVHADAPLSPARAQRVVDDVLTAWSDHVNPGFLLYRKSVAEGGAYAALEWQDDAADPHLSTLIDAEGNKYLDCLGGFGCFNVGEPRTHSGPRAGV